MLIRPGPAHIGAGAAPGGLVVHIYDTRDASLVAFHPIDLAAAAPTVAHAHAAELVHLIPAGVDVCLVFYDGDTGERVAPSWISEGWGGWY